jgi:hypothetical protein
VGRALGRNRVTGPSAEERIEQVRAALRGRALFWFGIRGEDAQSLLAVPEFAGSFAITAPLRSASLAADRNVTQEAFAGHRVDLDEYDLDLDASPAADAFRVALAEATNEPCVLLAYRPSGFVSSLAYSRNETVEVAAMFVRRQSAFEHKPWVETALAHRGVRMPRWRYVSREQVGRIGRLLADGPLILRANSSSGGVGIARVDHLDVIDELWPTRPDHFAAVSPELTDAVPVNVGGCVFADGTVRLHPPSVQLIGVPALTHRPFGYCGNDFDAIRRLSEGALAALDAMTREVGAWLHEERYLGAFGLDALVRGDEVTFLEVNPRFQGSTALGADLALELGEPSLYLDALAAHLGLVSGGAGRHLGWWAEHQDARSHLVVHRRPEDPAGTDRANATRLRELGSRLTLRPGVPTVDVGGVIGRLVVEGAVTTTGFDLTGEAPVDIGILRGGAGASPMGEGEA